LYETPPEAVWALLKHEPVPLTIWEPAAGPGAIVRVLRQSGRGVVATDLVDYGWPADFQARGSVDFLMEREAPPQIGAILTNPPFKLANEFVEHARRLCPLVYMLVRLAFYESERRSPILDAGDLARIYVFRKRLPMMHRAGWEGRKANSGMAFAWFCWDRGHFGKPTIERISWEPVQPSQPRGSKPRIEANVAAANLDLTPLEALIASAGPP
jgi:hypothetical protein